MCNGQKIFLKYLCKRHKKLFTNIYKGCIMFQMKIKGPPHDLAVNQGIHLEKILGFHYYIDLKYLCQEINYFWRNLFFDNS